MSLMYSNSNEFVFVFLIHRSKVGEEVPNGEGARSSDRLTQNLNQLLSS